MIYPPAIIPPVHLAKPFIISSPQSRTHPGPAQLDGARARAVGRPTYPEEPIAADLILRTRFPETLAAAYNLRAAVADRDAGAAAFVAAVLPPTAKAGAASRSVRDAASIEADGATRAGREAGELWRLEACAGFGHRGGEGGEHHHEEREDFGKDSHCRMCRLLESRV